MLLEEEVFSPQLITLSNEKSLSLISYCTWVGLSRLLSSSLCILQLSYTRVCPEGMVSGKERKDQRRKEAASSEVLLPGLEAIDIKRESQLTLNKISPKTCHLH